MKVDFNLETKINVDRHKSVIEISMGQVKLVEIYAWFVQSLNMSSIHQCPVMLSQVLYHLVS